MSHCRSFPPRSVSSAPPLLSQWLAAVGSFVSVVCRIAALPPRRLAYLQPRLSLSRSSPQPSLCHGALSLCLGLVTVHLCLAHRHLARPSLRISTIRQTSVAPLAERPSTSASFLSFHRQGAGGVGSEGRGVGSNGGGVGGVAKVREVSAVRAEVSTATQVLVTKVSSRLQVSGVDVRCRRQAWAGGVNGEGRRCQR